MITTLLQSMNAFLGRRRSPVQIRASRPVMRAFREGFCVLAVILVLSVGYFAPPIQAQDFPPPNPDQERAVFQKFTAKGSTPDQALTKAFAKAGIHWGQMLHPEANKEVSFSVMALPLPEIGIMIMPPPQPQQVYQAWVVVRYRVYMEGEGQ